MREFKITEDYYNTGVLFKKSTITIQPGLTVLVGCNGTGKTTLLNHIKDKLNKDKIPCYHYNNLKDGGTAKANEYMSKGKIEAVSTLLTSSEGENINNNLYYMAEDIGSFVRHGKSEADRSFDLFAELIIGSNSKSDTTKDKGKNERWILLDAIDSGFSIDNVIELKDFLHMIVNDGKKTGIDIYIVTVANEYELAANEQCLDVYNGEYRTFESYEEYKEFVLDSRKIKDERIKMWK